MTQLRNTSSPARTQTRRQFVRLMVGSAIAVPLAGIAVWPEGDAGAAPRAKRTKRSTVSITPTPEPAPPASDSSYPPAGSINVMGFGAKGDGVTDDSAAVQAALYASSGQVLYFPAATYIIGKRIDVPSNAHLLGYGATLKLTATGRLDHMLSITDVSDISIQGLTLDGNRAAFDAVATEEKHCIALYGAKRVAITDCVLKNAKGDGLLLESTYPQFAPSEDISVTNVRMDGNYRQGCSVISARRVRFDTCAFVNTAGTAPECGVDVESWDDAQVVEDVEFKNCEFAGNANCGWLIHLRESPTAPQHDVRFSDCQVHHNQRGVALTCARDIQVSGGAIRDNAQEGVRFEHMPLRNIAFNGVEIAGNGSHGMELTIWSSRVDQLSISGCTIRDNALGAPGARQGIHLFNGTYNDVKIENCRITGSSQQFGIYTNNWESRTTISQLSIAGNDLSGNGAAGLKLDVPCATQTVIDNVT